MSSRVLLSWIGNSDLRAMATSLPAAQRDEILKSIGGEPPRAGDNGATKTLLETQSFDEIRLLSNYPAEWNKRFLSWIKQKNAAVERVALEKPTDYRALF